MDLNEKIAARRQERSLEAALNDATLAEASVLIRPRDYFHNLRRLNALDRTVVVVITLIGLLLLSKEKWYGYVVIASGLYFIYFRLKEEIRALLHQRSDA